MTDFAFVSRAAPGTIEPYKHPREVVLRRRPAAAAPRQGRPGHAAPGGPSLRRAAAVLFLLAVAPLATGRVTADVTVESRTDRARMYPTMSVPYARFQGRTIESTSGDKQSLEFEQFIPTGAHPTPHGRIIVRLDKRVLWEIDYSDSSYTERTFDDFLEFSRHYERSAKWSRIRRAPPVRDTITGYSAQRIQYTSQADFFGRNASVYLDTWNSTDVPAEVRLFRQKLDRALRGWPFDLYIEGMPPGKSYGESVGRGYVMRTLMRVTLEPWWAPSDSAAPAPAIVEWDPGTRTMFLSSSVVVAVRTSPIPAETFDVPAGFKKW